MDEHIPHHGYPILIVEDNPVARKVLEKMLAKASYRTVSAQNGAEALALFENEFFPIVLTDWMMPEMNGLELCQAIRRMPNIGYVFIVLLTARDSKQDIITGLESGADDFIIKPVNPPELMARLKCGHRILELEQSLRQANKEIRLLSIQDPLTGCFNRSYLDERLPDEVKRAKRYCHPLSLIMCDIDHFKLINDTYGHQTGDRVLEKFARRIHHAIRDRIDWLVRYGGEEFLIVLPETDIGGACCAAEKLRRIVCDQPFKISDLSLTVTASFGASGYARITASTPTAIEKLIDRADQCLYKAKEQGRNRLVAGPIATPVRTASVN
jgi:diguanylate cyclase (GGDEF)-like protein